MSCCPDRARKIQRLWERDPMSLIEFLKPHRDELFGKKCIKCGNKFKPKQSSQKYCSKDCSDKAQQKITPEIAKFLAGIKGQFSPLGAEKLVYEKFLTPISHDTIRKFWKDS